MAEPADRSTRSGSETAILVIVALAVVVLIVWFIIGRGGVEDEGVDVDINVPAVEEGRGGGNTTGSML